MGRPQLFDHAAVLDAALKTFWEKGYTATSMADLCRATGLQPGSLYHSFGSKEGLFIRVIERYIDAVVEDRIENVLNQGSPVEGIEAFFLTTFEGLSTQDLIGCLLTNTATDFASNEEQINASVRKGLLTIERAFEARLFEAQDSGLLDAAINPSELAVHLSSCFQGLGVIARLTKDKKRLRVITSHVIASLSD